MDIHQAFALRADLMGKLYVHWRQIGAELGTDGFEQPR
jgi:hypothetical protein